MDYIKEQRTRPASKETRSVSILVVMDYIKELAPGKTDTDVVFCFNPCCDGLYKRT